MKKVIIAALALAPVLASAQSLSNIETLVRSIGRLVDLALPIVVALALLGFFWGLVKFIFAQGNEEGKTEGKKIMLWGIVALFVMVSVWGLVRFIGNAFGVNQGDTITVPRVPGL
jgi:heme/copper-type cytochrome/quinol oxidase subunit 4